MTFPYQELDLEQNTPEWEAWRNRGIGASDAPVIMGESRFKSRRTLLREKRGHLRPPKNKKMIRGTRLEHSARLSYSGRFDVELAPLCVQSLAHPWLRASLDGISPARDHLVEIKCGAAAYRQAKRDIVPGYYYGQLQHQLYVTGLKLIYYWCYWPGNTPRRITVARDPDYIDRMLAAEQAFYEELVAP